MGAGKPAIGGVAMPKKTILLISLVALVTILATSLVAAQPGGVLDMTWFTVDGGGGGSTGGSYALSGTAGQTDAGTTSSGGVYTLNGGFWQDGVTSTSSSYVLYLPLVPRP